METELKSLSKLRLEYEVKQEKIKILEEEINEQIEIEKEETSIALKTIRENYDKKRKPLKTEIQVLETESITLGKKLELFSSFDNKIIGEILAQLVTLYEGEDYSYLRGIYPTKIKKHDYLVVGIEKKIRAITKDEGENKGKLEGLYALVQNGEDIILCDDEHRLSKNIIFNKFVTINEENLMISDVRYGRFDYVKEFIEMVIDFRITNEMREINKIDLYKLLGEFLISRKDLIAANYQLRKEEQEEVFYKKLEENQSKYSSQLEKIIKQEPKKP